MRKLRLCEVIKSRCQNNDNGKSDLQCIEHFVNFYCINSAPDKYIIHI